MAHRYAGALFALALEKGIAATVLEDLDGACELLRKLPEAEEILSAPAFSHRIKRDVTDRLFSERVSPPVLDFLHMVVAKDRASLLEAIRNAFEEMKNRHEGVLAVRVISAVSLKPEEVERLAQVLHARTGQEIRPQCEVDPEILGGLIVVLGDTVLDGSIRTALLRLRERLLRVDVTGTGSA